MSKFIKVENKNKPTMSTAALPDIVFMLLFYFMVAASIKSSNYEEFISITLPYGQDLSKIEAKNLVNYIYVGKAQGSYAASRGTKANTVVADDRIIDLNEMPSIVNGWRNKVRQEDFGKLKTMINVDKSAVTGIVQDIEDQLGRNNLPKIVYSGKEGDPNQNF